jgi:hypothetical protein
MTSLPDFILDALPNPIDHSREFSAAVIEFKQVLQARLRTVFRLDQDMNYNPAQSLACTLKGKAGLQKQPYEFDVRFYLSSKAPLFAVYCFDRQWGLTDRGDANHPIAQERLPERIQAWTDKAKAVLIDKGWTEVEHACFHLAAPGCSTQLDGLPATVFESLFAEIV